jgi:hypothetical protein
MKERPILFSAPMVRALLADTKTQTRRVVKLPHENPLGRWEVLPWGGPNGGRTRDGQTVPFQNVIGHSRTGEIIGCPYGQPGDRLWVRETFRKIDGQTRPWIETDYRATYTHGDRLGDSLGVKMPWTPAIHMPRAASRITLEVTGVRVERLQDISEADAKAEGACAAEPCDHARRSCADIGCSGPQDYRGGYRALWESINGPGSWAANPWVWVVEFTRIAAVR